MAALNRNFWTVYLTFLVASLMAFTIAEEPVSESSDSFPHWEQFRFGGDYKIERIELTVLKDADVPWGDGLLSDGTKALNFSINDKAVLEFVERCFCRTERTAAPIRGEVSMTHYDLGKLSVSTSRGKFDIGFTNLGFTKETTITHPINLFTSWGLARILDDLIAAEDPNNRIKAAHFKLLSGERSLEVEKAYYSKTFGKQE